MRVPLAAMLVGVLLLPGCIEQPDTAVPVGGEVPSGALRLDASGGLLATTAAESVVPLAWGWRQWLDGIEAPAWTSAPAERAYVVTSANAHVVYEASRALASPGQRPELTVWWGVEDSVVDHGFAAGPPVLAAGDRAVGEFDLALPVGGLVVLPGERLTLRIGSYYLDDAVEGGIGVVVGEGDTTMLTIETTPVDLPGLTLGQPTRTMVALTGGRCLGLDPATDADLVWLPVEVNGSVRAVDIVLDRLSGDGPPDVDMVLLDADGEVIAHAAGSAGHEAIRLRAPNLALAPAPWQLGIYACTPQNAEAQVDIALHTSA